jgi:hypothetical protein
MEMSVGVLSVAGRLVRLVRTREAICSLAPLISSAYWFSMGCGMINWKRIKRVSFVFGIMGLTLAA